MNSVDASHFFWPTTLLLPAPTKVVAFDTFVWRELSIAAAGRPRRAGYTDLLRECRAAVARRAALFPVSKEFLVETNKYGGPDGRAAVAHVVAEIGHLQSLASRRLVRQLELDAALTAELCPPRVELGPYLLVGRTLMHAFDQEMVLLRWDATTGANLNHSVEARTEATIREAERLGDMLSLQVALLCSGDVGGAYTAPSDATLAREMHIRRQLDRTGKRTASRRLRDVFLADELGHEIDHREVDQAFGNRGTTFERWLAADTRRRTSEIVERMPSCAVSLELRTRYHRDRRMRFEQNDVHDIGFVSVALPYCDAVYADGPVWRTLQACDLDHRMNTRLLTDPEDAADYISHLPAVSGAGAWRLPDPEAAPITEDPASDLTVDYYFELWDSEG